jgi:hypothetical protein
VTSITGNLKVRVTSDQAESLFEEAIKHRSSNSTTDCRYTLQRMLFTLVTSTGNRHTD